MKKQAIICDLDGTLCDTTWRNHFLNSRPKDWDGFFAGIPYDPIVFPVHNVLQMYKNYGAEIIFLTGRDEKKRDVTAKWLTDRGYGSNHLFMRTLNDKRHDYIVKEEIYRAQIEPLYDVELILEDRQQVVDMWRGLGLRCWQVAAGDF